MKRLANYWPFIVIELVLIAFYYLTGIADNRYHFIDDHEFYRIYENIRTDGFFSTVTHWIINDLHIRLRPFYYFQRCLEVYLCGVNYTRFYIYNFIISSITLIYGYKAFRNFGASIFLAFLGLFVAFYGLQLEIWWKLAPAENIGSCLFFVSLYMATLRENALKYKVVFIISILLMSLSKESFALTIPFFIAFRLYIARQDEKLWTVIFREYSYLSILLVIFFLEMMAIKYIGTDNIGYAGVDSSFTHLIEGIKRILTTDLISYCYVIAIVLIIAILSVIFDKKAKDFLLTYYKRWIFSFAFLLLIVVPNLVIYAKSGMSYRYLLPCTVGITLFILSSLQMVRDKFLYLIATGVVIFPMITSFDLLKSEIQKYNQVGVDIKQITTEIARTINSNSKVLIICDPALHFEQSFSLMNYIEIELKNTNVSLMRMDTESHFDPNFYAKLIVDWGKMVNGKIYNPDTKSPDIVYVFPECIIDSLKMHDFNLSRDYCTTVKGVYILNKNSISISNGN